MNTLNLPALRHDVVVVDPPIEDDPQLLTFLEQQIEAARREAAMLESERSQLASAIQKMFLFFEENSPEHMTNVLWLREQIRILAEQRQAEQEAQHKAQAEREIFEEQREFSRRQQQYHKDNSFRSATEDSPEEQPSVTEAHRESRAKCKKSVWVDRQGVPRGSHKR